VLKKFFLFSLLFLTTPAHALVLDALYQAEVPVSSQNASDRSRAVKKGLEQVLIKVSGNSSVATVGTVQNNIHQFESLLQQYSYYKTDATQNQPAQLMLRVRFDTAGVNRMLKHAGQAVWGTNRPLVLVWIAKQDHDSRELVGSGSDEVVSKAIQAESARRGLPIMLPLMDIHDKQTITFADVWNPRPINVREASKRYNADAILVGRSVKKYGEEWQGHWELLMGSEDQLTWDYSETTESKVLSNAISDVTDALASRFAILDSIHKQSEVLLHVSNIDDFQVYEKVMSYLRGLSPVTAIQVLSIEPSEVQFKLQVVGGEQSIIQAIALNQLLQPSRQSDFTLLGRSSLDYIYTR